MWCTHVHESRTGSVSTNNVFHLPCGINDVQVFMELFPSPKRSFVHYFAGFLSEIALMDYDMSNRSPALVVRSFVRPSVRQSVAFVASCFQSCVAGRKKNRNICRVCCQLSVRLFCGGAARVALVASARTTGRWSPNLQPLYKVHAPPHPRRLRGGFVCRRQVL